MPPTNRSSAGIQPLLDKIGGLERQVAAMQTQQTQVVTDPSGATGDPAHGFATVVIGNLLPITGIAAFGVAVWSQAAGAWTRLLPGAGAFSAYRSTAVNAPTGAFTDLVLNAEEFDVSGWYDTATGRYAPQVPGIYRLSGAWGISAAMVAGRRFIGSIFQNGAEYKRLFDVGPNASVAQTQMSGSVLVRANGSSDFFTLATFQDSGAPQPITVSQQATYFQGEMTGL